MSRVFRALGVVSLLSSSLLFAYYNSGQRVTLRLGFATLYGVPLTAIAFGSVIAGMVVMLVAGVRSDMKVRRILRARLHEETREELGRFVDDSQQDLFDAPGGAPESIVREVWTPAVAAPPISAREVSPPEETAPPPPLVGGDEVAASPPMPDPLDESEGVGEARSAEDEDPPLEWRPIDATP
ncbi:MAG: hypothetical protein AAF389_16220 [Gemmatimonadota bacterium]